MERLFWSIEKDYLDEFDKVVQKCEAVTNLKEALDTGLNGIYLKINEDYDYVGWKEEDGTYNLTEPYNRMWENGKRDGLEVTYCHFIEVDHDDDGYTVGYFQMERPYDAD